MSMDEIWEIQDVDRFIAALENHVLEKCDSGDDVRNLSDPERFFLIVQLCENEVNNGGFVQFFDNFSGKFANEVVDAFRAIGAPRVAEICATALSVFGSELPLDWKERRKYLDTFNDDEEIDLILNECDESFYRHEEDLNALNYAYVLKNKADFS